MVSVEIQDSGNVQKCGDSSVMRNQKCMGGQNSKKYGKDEGHKLN